MKIGAILSLPRLGWNETWGCILDALQPLNIPVRRIMGAFYAQSMQRGMNSVINSDLDAVLCLDYDSVFKRSQVEQLIKLLEEHPEADAIAATQPKRNSNSPLCTLYNPNITLRESVPIEEFQKTLTEVGTSHFGLTLIRTSAIRKMPKPWFYCRPSDEGEYDDERIDADIWFWLNWQKQGLRVFQANDIRIGHLQLLITWMDTNLQLVFQHPSDFASNGIPSKVAESIIPNMNEEKS